MRVDDREKRVPRPEPWGHQPQRLGEEEEEEQGEMAGGTNCPNKHVLSTQHVPSTVEVPGRVTQLWEKRDHLDPTRYGQTLPRSGALELSLKKRPSVGDGGRMFQKNLREMHELRTAKIRRGPSGSRWTPTGGRV